MAQVEKVEVLETRALFNEAFNLHNGSSLGELLERFGLFVNDGDVQIIDSYEDRENEKIIMFASGKSLIGYVRRFYSSYDLILYPLLPIPFRVKGKSTSASVSIMFMLNNVHTISIINERKRKLRGLKKMVEEIRRARGNVNMEKVEELLGKLGVKVTSPNSLKSKVEPERVFGCTKYVEIIFYDQSYHSPHMRILISTHDPYVHIMFYRNDVELEITPLVPTEISYSYSYPYSYKL